MKANREKEKGVPPRAEEWIVLPSKRGHVPSPDTSTPQPAALLMEQPTTAARHWPVTCTAAGAKKAWSKDAARTALLPPVVWLLLPPK